MNILEIALSFWGEKEIDGEVDNPVIVNFSEATNLEVSDDETPWCSSFINYCAREIGLERTGKANARSWLDVGRTTSLPDVGDIVVFKRGDSTWQGHVGIFIRRKDGFVYVLGGNQSNSVKISPYNENDVLGYRILTKI